MWIKVHTQVFIIFFSILVKTFEKFYDKTPFGQQQQAICFKQFRFQSIKPSVVLPAQSLQLVELQAEALASRSFFSFTKPPGGSSLTTEGHRIREKLKNINNGFNDKILKIETKAIPKNIPICPFIQTKTHMASFLIL